MNSNIFKQAYSFVGVEERPKEWHEGKDKEWREIGWIDFL